MKKTIFILAMLLMALTSFGQQDKRTTNTERSAQRNKSARTEASKEKASAKQKSSDADNKPRIERSERDVNRETQTNTSTTTRDRNSETSRPQQDNQDRRTSREIDNDKPERLSPEQHTDVNRSRESERTSQSRNHAAHTAPHNDYSSPRVYREHHDVNYHYNRPPENRSYRSVHYVYRPPVDIHIVWTPTMHRRYIEIYPMIRVWYYPMGYRIETISAYEAMFYTGEVMNVYGRVNEVFYSHGTDEYFLYIGPYYPYQDFTVVLPGWIARSLTRQPLRFFENQYILTTGLITSFENVPEIVVRDQAQINLY